MVVESLGSMSLQSSIKIIHVFPYSAQMAGGHSNAIIAFMQSQIRRGMRVCGISPIGERVPIELSRSIQDLQIHELDFESPDFFRKAMEFAKDCEQSVFHFHGYTPRFSRMSRELTKTGIHYVVTSHGQLHYREKFHWLKKFIFINFAEAFFHNASGLHFLTEREKARSCYVLPFWRRPVLVQPNVVTIPDPDTVVPLPREQFEIPAGAFVFAYLGRLHVKHKGLDVLLSAFARVASESDVYLVMIGGDWEGGRAWLENMARQLNCAHRVRFLGAQFGENKWRALKMADAFVSPSRWEAFGIAQAEAMGFGVPTILSDCMNLAPEAGRHKAALLSPLASDALANLMQEMMRSRPMRESLRIAGRKWVLENCSQSVAGIRFEQFYREVLGDIEESTSGVPVVNRAKSGLETILNVVHVFPYPPRISGGHSNAIRSFIECQRENGINAVGIGPKAAGDHEAADLGFPLREVDSVSRLRWETIASQFGILAGSTVIHFHNVTRDYAPLMKDLQRRGIPYVFTGHGQFSFRNALHWFKKFVYLHLVDSGSRRAAGLHFLTKSVEGRSHFLLPGFSGVRMVLGNLVTAPDFTRIPVASRHDFEIPDDAFILLFLGRLDVEIKGLDLLVEALSFLPSDRFRLIMAGPDWNGGRARLERLAEGYGCRERVSFPGPVYGEKKWSLFKMADVFVSPSRYEAFNITQAEAMSSGLPVVTSTATSLAPELRFAGAAILSPLAAQPLAHAIATMEADPSLCRIMSARSQAWVKLNCDPRRAGNLFRSFYESVLEKTIPSA